MYLDLLINLKLIWFYLIINRLMIIIYYSLVIKAESKNKGSV